MEESRPPELDPQPLAKLGMLVAGIAHNLYGPLTGILGTLDLLKLKHPDIGEDLDRVAGLGRRLQSEIGVMLHKAEIENKGRIVQVSLPDLVANEIEFYKGDPRFKHQMEVVFDPPGDIPVFLGPAGAFSQSLSNLFANAVEATLESEEKRLEVGLALEGDRIVLTVSDSGEGMDEQTRERAFEPFFTTKTPSREEGKFPPVLALGLGLTHAKNMLDPLGVPIELESEPGQGTTVTLRVPYKQINDAHQMPMA
jgi:signal transduction histidine kinase